MVSVNGWDNSRVLGAQEDFKSAADILDMLMTVVAWLGPHDADEFKYRDSI